MPAYKELFERNMNPVFIETGSLYGDGIQAALDAGFETIYSIELSPGLYDYCKNRFKAKLNVNLILGDSGEILGELMKTIAGPVTLWLDSHYSEGETARGKEDCPLMREIDAIAEHPVKTHTILIDDLRCWNMKDHGFDLQTLMRKIHLINPGYLFMLEDGRDKYLRVYHNDILVARCQ
jgi:hypothetical protein